MPSAKDKLRRQQMVARFMAKVELTPTCWIWKGALTKRGYGTYRIGKRSRKSHQASYLIFVGPIPPKMEIDHKCLNRACVNPDHLEAVTHRENMRRGNTVAALNARKTTCPKGHPYEGENLVIRKDGSRECRTCTRERMRQWRQDRQRG